MKVLVIGSGGREHALVWKIASSPRVEKVFCAPGNGGISELADCVPLKPDDIRGLKDFAVSTGIDLTIVGPEMPLVAGIVDEFNQAGLKIFGPGKELAQMEGSKVFAKETMKRLGVPTGGFEVFTSAGEALSYLEKAAMPIVVKADGLAAGKGVVVARKRDEATAAVRAMMQEKRFGDAGARVVIEECLQGEEASIIVFSDGKTTLPLASSQDHKRIGIGDTGPNTGGMGAYSPAPVVDENMQRRVMDEIINPLIGGLAAEGKVYRGILYAGIMATVDGPRVLEFNVRFGDPETQAILPRMKSDLVEVIDKVLEGKLSEAELSWDERPCVCVVLASGGYPGTYQKGFPIAGFKEAEQIPGVVVFHAGTAVGDSGSVVTAGGRVLGVTALGNNIQETIDQVYEAVSKIYFEGMYFRSDIACRALSR